MCTNPGLLPNGQLVGCRKCWQCQELRINDWLGRNIAESRSCNDCHFVTLTYGEDRHIGGSDHERAVVLTYSDVQKWVKKLRKAGHKFRYFAVGEYGAEKARSHWHVLMYWKNTPPALTLNKLVNDQWWEHGFSKWEDIRKGPAAVRYACKYIQKDVNHPERQGQVVMSKKPPLGTDYFEHLAQKYVDQGLAPQTLTYGWPDVLNKKGERLRFMLRGKVAENFVTAFERRWRETYGESVHSPWSQCVEDVLDKITRREDMGEMDSYRAGVPWGKIPGGITTELKMHAMFKKWYVVYKGIRYWWGRDAEGNHAWISEDEEERRNAVNKRRFELRDAREVKASKNRSL